MLQRHQTDQQVIPKAEQLYLSNLKSYKQEPNLKIEWITVLCAINKSKSKKKNFNLSLSNQQTNK